MTYVENLDKKLSLTEGYQILSEIVSLVKSDVELTREEAIYAAKMLDIAEAAINADIETIVIAESAKLKGEYICEKMLYEKLTYLSEAPSFTAAQKKAAGAGMKNMFKAVNPKRYKRIDTAKKGGAGLLGLAGLAALGLGAKKVLGKKKTLGAWKKLRGVKLSKLKKSIRKGLAGKVKGAKKYMKTHPTAVKRTKVGLLGAAGLGAAGLGAAALRKEK